MKLPVALIQKAEAEFARNPAEVARVRRHIANSSAVALDGAEHVAARRAMIVASSRDPASLAFERYLGNNDLLSINYLQIGTAQARAVGRIRYFDKREQRTAFATGFMVSPELMLTNHHVFPVADPAAFAAFADDACIAFGFEFGIDGKPCVPVVHALDPTAFLYAFDALDLAIVAVRPLDATGQHPLSTQGYLVLNGALGKAGTGDFATIVQHPDGQEKQIAIRNNEIIDNSLADVLIYKSDTAPGSSGAPVFNNEWQVIALHSAGVPKQDAQGRYLDKDGQVIDVVDGGVDEARVVWLSNRGVRTSAIVQHLRATPAVALHPLGQIFASPAYTDNRAFAALPALPALPVGPQSAGAPAAAPFVPVEIRISIGAGAPLVQMLAGPPVTAALSSAVDMEKKLEDDRDYSRCLGFDEDFMGVHIALPVPGPKLRKQLAFLKNNPSACVLKYHHFSSIQHALRRVPVLSAINVSGKHRFAALGSATRQDQWLRDNRIDYAAQLDDAWYANSGFDKGHLSRREDAEWGQTLAAARTAADMTCSYANAVPQVPGFNRAVFGQHGQWGELEMDLLEQGVAHEGGKAARICVFTGPLFDADDPVHASVQVALSCFKVVAWYAGDGTLRATAYRLSQQKLVGGIAFEVLNFDRLFKLEQKPLKWIETATGLQFPAVLKKADTFHAA